MQPYANPALYKIDVPALSYIYAAYGKSSLISNGKELEMPGQFPSMLKLIYFLFIN
jgi:hypothetical protein